jgi:hypothetical protein
MGFPRKGSKIVRRFANQGRDVAQGSCGQPCGFKGGVEDVSIISGFAVAGQLPGLHGKATAMSMEMPSTPSEATALSSAAMRRELLAIKTWVKLGQVKKDQSVAVGIR